MDHDKRIPTPRQTRLALILGVPLALALGSNAVAWAVTLPKDSFTSGTKLLATDLTGNFQTLRDAVTALETRATELESKPAVSLYIGDIAAGSTATAYVNFDNIRGKVGDTRQIWVTFNNVNGASYRSLLLDGVTIGYPGTCGSAPAGIFSAGYPYTKPASVHAIVISNYTGAGCQNGDMKGVTLTIL